MEFREILDRLDEHVGTLWWRIDEGYYRDPSVKRNRNYVPISTELSMVNSTLDRVLAKNFRHQLGQDDRKQLSLASAELKFLLEKYEYFEGEEVNDLAFEHLSALLTRLEFNIDKIQHDYFLGKSIDEIPEQDPVIHIAIDPTDGTIGFDRREGQSDAERLKHVLPGMWRMIAEAQEILKTGNLAYGALCDALDDYLEETERPPETIDFGILQMLSRQLENSLNKAREKDADPEFPDLPDKAEIKTQTVLDLHGSVMASSEIGEQIILKKEQYDETAEEMRAMSDAISDLQAIIANSEGVFKDDVKGLIVEGLDPGVGERDINQRLFSRGLAKNIGIVSVYAATMAGAAATMGPAAAAIAWVMPDAVKEAAAELGDEAKRNLIKIKNFTLTHVNTLRRTTTLADRGRWFDGAILKIMQRDRIEAQSDGTFPQYLSGPKLDLNKFRELRRVVIFDHDEIRGLAIVAYLENMFQLMGIKHAPIMRGALPEILLETESDPAIVMNMETLANLPTETRVKIDLAMEKSRTKHLIYNTDHFEHFVFPKWPGVTALVDQIVETSHLKVLIEDWVLDHAKHWEEYFSEKYADF